MTLETLWRSPLFRARKRGSYKGGVLKHKFHEYYGKSAPDLDFWGGAESTAGLREKRVPQYIPFL